jgi:hypothetical protein
MLRLANTRLYSFLSSVQNAKLRDTPNIAKELPQASRGLWGWYHRKYIEPGGAAPIYDIIAFIGILSYSLHYNHIKHVRDERESHEQDGKHHK